VPIGTGKIAVRSKMNNTQPSDLTELRLLAARYGLPIEHVVGRITLRPREIANALGVGLRSVEQWIAIGKLPSVLVERTVMVPIHDLLRFLEENRRIPRSHRTPSLAQRARALLDGEAK
jgi:excisionase family DNA binding protein